MHSAIRRVLPLLVHTHPGFARVLGAFLIIDGGVGLGYVLGGDKRASSPAFEVMRSLAPVEAWGAVHLAIAALILFGLYEDFTMVRVGCFMGASLHTFAAVSFAASAILNPDASPNGAVLFGAVALIHAAAFREPQINPANLYFEDRRPTRRREDR